MQVLIVLKNVSYFTILDTVVPRLAAGGHHILALSDEERSQGKSSWAIDACLANTPNLSTAFTIRRSDGWRRALFSSRELRSYASYLNRADQSEYYLKRWENYINDKVKGLVRRSKTARAVVGSRLSKNVMYSFERLAPPDPAITLWLKEHRPDVVVATPMNMRFCEEVEYVKAARALGIPTVVPVYSWDNLTTKGLFQVIPDVVLAWNQAQYEEATQIHGVPAEQVVITGAPRFDEWFTASRFRLERADFCRQAGLDPDRPFLLYLGSSANIAKNETWLVQELAASLKASPDANLARMQVLVRPHPANVRIYEQLEGENISVWPKGRNTIDTDDFRQGFYNSLLYCVATVGINTTGMIDAVINDRPGITIMTETYRKTQMEAVHFRQLLKADVLEVAGSVAECIQLVGSIQKGVDLKQAERRQFVHDYIRPNGLEHPAGEVAAHAIELAGMGKSASEIRAILAEKPV
jgi:hypothetical protein